MMDERSAKVRRTEIRDLDRRLSPQQQKGFYINNSSGHSIAYDNKLPRDIKDTRDAVSGSWDVKEEIKGLNIDMSCSRSIANVARLDATGNENGFNFDKTSAIDLKSNLKPEKENWTELRDNNYTKRYSKSPSNRSHSSKSAKQVIDDVNEVGKVYFVADVKEPFKQQVVIGNIDFDPKNEKLKGKDWEKKDWRYESWREIGNDNNYHRSIQLGIVSNGKKEVEESEVGRLLRATSNIQKENERKERDPAKKEMPNMVGIDCLPFEKHIDKPKKVEEQETLAYEPRKSKYAAIKGNDTECMGKKQEKNLQIHGEMYETCGSYDYKAKDGSDGFGATEDCSESIVPGFQQCKRIRYSRGSPRNSDPESFSSKTCDHERIQDKEVATIVYKPGESIPELLKLWKDFEASLENKNGDIVQHGSVLDIRIPPQHVSSTNHQLRYAQMWGTDVYTIDSDVVAVLIHTGYCRPLSSPLPAAIDELRATIRVLPPQDCYLSTVRNNIHSRAWGSSAPCSYQIESCSIVKKGGEIIKLEPHFTHISGLEPTIAPLPVEHTMMTRSAAISNSLSPKRFVREVSIQYNLCNEPWFKYGINIVADKGMRKPLYTSARLKRGEVLYLETHVNRYELCFNGEKACSDCCASTSYRGEGETAVDIFRWSRCKKAFPEQMMRSFGIPLPAEHLVVLEENLDWEDIQWSQAGVWIAGKEYKLARVHFFSPK